MTFGTLGHSKVREKKSIFVFFLRVVEGADPCLGDADTHASHMCQFPLFLLHMQAQKKKLSKRKRRYEISRSAERDKGSAR